MQNWAEKKAARNFRTGRSPAGAFLQHHLKTITRSSCDSVRAPASPQAPISTRRTQPDCARSFKPSFENTQSLIKSHTMAKPRQKKRTHVGASNPQKPVDAKVPRSMVIRIGAGQVGSSVSQLATDVRRVLEPNTASRLKERRAVCHRPSLQLHIVQTLIWTIEPLKGLCYYGRSLGRVPFPFVL